jgi:hypothetical protein
LIRRVERIDKNARRFKRAATMKIYLTNPCLRAALFEPVVSNSPAMGSLIETAMFAAFFEGGLSGTVKYARWEEGEIDFVSIWPDGAPIFAVECKWSNTFFSDDRDLAPYVEFALRNRLKKVFVTSKSTFKNLEINGVHIEISPTSWFVEVTGTLTSRDLSAGGALGASSDGAPYFRSAPPKSSA